MNAEKLIQKGVRKHFDGQKVFFDVDSLNEHYNDLLLHNSDIVKIEDGDYIALEDVNFDHATANEVVVTEETLADNPEFVEAGIEVGEIITVAAEEEVVAPVTTKKKRRK